MSAEFVAQTVANMLSLGGTYALLAIGLALIFSILGLINFAHGDLMTTAGYALLAGIAAFTTFGIACLVAVAASVLLAISTDRVAFQPVRGQPLATTLLTSYAVGVILHVGFQNFISPRPLAVRVLPWLTGPVDLGGVSVGAIQLVSIVSAFAAASALAALLKLTPIGIAMRAAAQDFAMARLMGIRADLAIMTAFAASGALAGIAGILWVAQRGSVDPLMGFVPVIKAFIAAVLGGLGSLTGAAIGGLLLGVVEVGLRTFLPDSALPFREALTLLIVIAILTVRPHGLLGSTIESRQ